MSLLRREFLQSAASLGLWYLCPPMDCRAAERRGPERVKSLITLWLNGGPSQLETWDPHPGTLIGGQTKAIDTRLSGVKIAHLYPQTAEQLQHFNVIRSLTSKEGDHERASYVVKTGYRPDPTLKHPSVGSILMHELPDPRVEIPQHISIGDESFAARGGYLGNQFDAFHIYEAGANIMNLQPPVEDIRQNERLGDLDVISRAFLKGRESKVEKSLHQHTVDAARKMMKSDQLAAFDMKQESATTRQAYGENPFGRGCLVARRLVESGVRAVEVTLNGFDSHAKNFESHAANAKILDPALAALTHDLVSRDLWDSTLVLVIGEFGRTPKINPLGGRDHWPTGFSCLIGGGGLKSGVLIGETDAEGVKKDPTEPVTIANLYATLLKTLGVDFQKELITPIGRPMKFCEGQPIARLLPG